jgi:hypothetical protein
MIIELLAWILKFKKIKCVLQVDFTRISFIAWRWNKFRLFICFPLINIRLIECSIFILHLLKETLYYPFFILFLFKIFRQSKEIASVLGVLFTLFWCDFQCLHRNGVIIANYIHLIAFFDLVILRIYQNSRGRSILTLCLYINVCIWCSFLIWYAKSSICLLLFLGN